VTQGNVGRGIEWLSGPRTKSGRANKFDGSGVYELVAFARHKGTSPSGALCRKRWEGRKVDTLQQRKCPRVHRRLAAAVRKGVLVPVQENGGVNGIGTGDVYASTGEVIRGTEVRCGGIQDSKGLNEHTQEAGSPFLVDHVLAQPSGWLHRLFLRTR
jgi:hypothetical protein